MVGLHEGGIGDWQLRTGYLLSALATVGVLVSGVSKLFPATEIHDLLRELGLEEHAVAIGIVEIALVILYWLPRTGNLGFFLFCVYVGAILMAEILLGDLPIPALGIGALLFTGTLLRKPSLLGGRGRRGAGAGAAEKL